MEGTYDDDFHTERGFESFDDWYDSEGRDTDEYDYVVESRYGITTDEEYLKWADIPESKMFDAVVNERSEKKFREYLRGFQLKKCSNSSCNGNFILKYNKPQNALFWGCSNYPYCKFTASININITTDTKCAICGSAYKVAKIYSKSKISLICDNEYCQDTITISIDDYFAIK